MSLIWAVTASNAVCIFQWYFWGYSLAFSPTATNGFIGNLANFGLMNVLDDPSPGSPLIPALLYSFYQMEFACVTVGILVGGIAERGRVLPAMVITFLWMTLVYCPLACWAWNINGWGYKWGVLDYAGKPLLVFDPCHIIYLTLEQAEAPSRSAAESAGLRTPGFSGDGKRKSCRTLDPTTCLWSTLALSFSGLDGSGSTEVVRLVRTSVQSWQYGTPCSQPPSVGSFGVSLTFAWSASTAWSASARELSLVWWPLLQRQALSNRGRLSSWVSSLAQLVTMRLKVRSY